MPTFKMYDTTVSTLGLSDVGYVNPAHVVSIKNHDKGLVALSMVDDDVIILSVGKGADIHTVAASLSEPDPGDDKAVLLNTVRALQDENRKLRQENGQLRNRVDDLHKQLKLYERP